MLHEKAMIVNLTVKAWSARKRDRDVGKEVEKHHAAHDAGNFNKLLIDKVHLKPLESLCSAIRDEHYKMTLPWGDNGDRILPSTMYFDYTAKMRDMRAKLQTAAHDFAHNYPTYKQNARKRLGTMYDPEDYPDASVIPNKFKAEISVLPVPQAKNFLVDIGAEEVEIIRKNIEVQIAEQQKLAVNDLWLRLKEVVEKVHERLSDPDAVFRDSLIENARFISSIAQKLNITNDEDMEAIRQEIDRQICPFAPERLREDKTLRKQVAESARKILGKFPN